MKWHELNKGDQIEIGRGITGVVEEKGAPLIYDGTARVKIKGMKWAFVIPLGEDIKIAALFEYRAEEE